ncbi:hypothetical protein NDA11_002105 [Ustilago hordei]|uniref:Uncharacterized protein n=1 Tax=Ustilago hordei TaxID=120017 RepID=I2G564_USTHO|nr:uncharacterized protein UHO2_01724 [Ustilago hordei]KAJ1039422.1 hypothetical protein NDA10_000327 [Ustilago hordei]KAJ1586132.1 hypothetical protein NDA12_005181 [Ustilago hordei]KAJ1589068.1 hypothetical protein NDA15_002066 [Ustilago hordei]KAJ1590725.1 hypothetical protein NDA11_002105 [Ustilago hordei]KAJ1600460.1 hypothetical protein NDA14_000514 [Ustilago hordei]
MSIAAELATPFLIAEIIACQSDCSPQLNSPAGGGLCNHDEMKAAREQDRKPGHTSWPGSNVGEDDSRGVLAVQERDLHFDTPLPNISQIPFESIITLPCSKIAATTVHKLTPDTPSFLRFCSMRYDTLFPMCQSPECITA